MTTSKLTIDEIADLVIKVIVRSTKDGILLSGTELRKEILATLRDPSSLFCNGLGEQNSVGSTAKEHLRAYQRAEPDRDCQRRHWPYSRDEKPVRFGRRSSRL